VPSLRASLPVLCVVVTACGGSHGTGPPVRIQASAPRAEGELTSGAADALAAELLLASGAVVASPLRPAFVINDQALADAIAFTAFGHLRAEAFGAGTGPQIAGSARIRRLATTQHTDIATALAVEDARLAAAAGTTPPPGTWQVLCPWRQSSAALAQPTDSGLLHEPASWLTESLPGAAPTLDLADIGAAMTARVLAAGQLLQRSRGSYAGASADDGLLGLYLLQQLLAAEETLVDSMFVRAGLSLPLPPPDHYDPVFDPHWLPASQNVVLEPSVPGAPSGYAVIDGASDLLGLARVLRAAAELTWLASDADPLPVLRDLFRGYPFGEAGGPRPQGNGPRLSWDDNARPLIWARCGSCHLGFPTGGFLVDTLATVRAGSPRTQQLGKVMIVPGDHTQSFLWQIVTGPPLPFELMPIGSRLPGNEIQLIADWIDQGALEHSEVVTPPPAPGTVLAAVLFRNLVALHLDPATGGLHHRHEGLDDPKPAPAEQHPPSGLATAVSSGAALQALAAMAQAMPQLQYRDQGAVLVLAQAADSVASRLVDAGGRVAAAIGITTDLPAEPGGLVDQAAVTAGLLAAVNALPPSGLPAQHAAAAGRRAATVLLQLFRDPASGLFAEQPGFAGARLPADTLADLLAALRLAAVAGVEGAAPAQQQLLARLRPVLAYAEWSGRGEVIGDGIADTDGNGVPEPAAAGGTFGRLPLLASVLLTGPEDQRPPPTDTVTWTRHVRPLLLANCGSCHLNGNDQGHYRLDSVTRAGTPGDSAGALPMLVPGDPERSLLYRKLVDRTPPLGEQMPQRRPPLDAHGKELVRRWILQGVTSR